MEQGVAPLADASVEGSPAGRPAGDVPPVGAGVHDGRAAAPPKALTMFELAKLEEARRQAAQVDSRVRESASAVRAMTHPSRLIAAGGFLVACSIAIALYAPLKSALRGAQPYHRITE